MSIETTVLSNLLENETFVRRALVFIKPEYFTDSNHKVLFGLMEKYFLKFNCIPSKEALFIDLENITGLNESQYKDCKILVDSLQSDNTTKLEWLIEQTEKFCQDKAIYNAIMLSIKVLDNQIKDLTKGAIPKILSDALSISFSTNIGHDFLNDWETRYDLYHTKEKRIPFDLECFNKITRGGLTPKTLNVILAGTGVGKSAFMCHCATSYIKQGFNVLYITGEMSEEKIAERVDANIMDIPIPDLSSLTKDKYKKSIETVRGNVNGKLIIKEYPTATAHCGHFRVLLNELKLKKNFFPDIIIIDYLNIFCSSRIKLGAGVNSYTFVKSIAEEMRGLAVEYNLPILTATQSNRGAQNSSDIGIENTSESMGLPSVADLLFALISTEQLQELGQIMVKQLKNRYNDPSYYRRFVIGVQTSKMRFFDVEQEAQEDLVDSPIMDKGSFTEDNYPTMDMFRGLK